MAGWYHAACNITSAATRERYNGGGMCASPVAEHKGLGPPSVRCYVLTVSDTRTEDTDTSGHAIVDLLTGAGHVVSGHAIVKDDPELVREAVRRQLANADVRVIFTTGGTGITSRDSTYEAVNAMLDKRLDGFGELFRMLSYEQIGPAAMMSRACAGLTAGRIIISLPGSEAAVRLAMERLVIPELGHLVQQASK
jgi:molybdopterin adenylyltransferase